MRTLKHRASILSIIGLLGRRILVPSIVGAAVGPVFGMMGGLISAPHAWPTLARMQSAAEIGIFSGFFVGALVGVLGWVMDIKSATRMCAEKARAAIGQRAVDMLFWGTNGAILGGYVGAIAEIAIALEWLIAHPKGGFFRLGDLHGILFVAPVAGLVVGLVYGATHKTIDASVAGLIKGLVFGAIYGLPQIPRIISPGRGGLEDAMSSMALVLTGVAFGVLVSVASEALNRNLVDRMSLRHRRAKTSSRRAE